MTHVYKRKTMAEISRTLSASDESVRRARDNVSRVGRCMPRIKGRGPSIQPGPLANRRSRRILMKLRVCSEPGCAELTKTSQCAAHTSPRAERNTTAHKKARAQTLREEHVCWICGKPRWFANINPQTGKHDPLTADHVLARARGGLDLRSNYRAAHLSCNSSRGDAPSIGRVG